MLNLCIFYCPCHNDEVLLFDDGIHKPVTGVCKHTICEECVKKQEDKSCPFCHQEGAFVGKSPNYQGIKIIVDRRLNFWENLKDWWTGEKFDNGNCSSCEVSPTAYRICLTCHGDRLCAWTPEIRLKIKSNGDLLNFFGNVICRDCADENHKDHETIMISGIKYAERDIKLAAANIILELFRKELKDKEGSIDCKLRHMQVESAGIHLSKLVKELDSIDKEECGFFQEPVKMELIKRYIVNVDKKKNELINENSEEGPICECTRLYEKIEKSGLKTQLQYTYNLMSKDDIERLTPGCPIFFRTHSKERERLCAMVGEVPSERLTPEPFDVRQCPLCVMREYRDHKNKPEEVYVKNWMTIVYDFWNSDKSHLENFCLQCLQYLKRYGVFTSCENFNLQIKKKSAKCTHENCIMKNPYYFKYVMNREFVSDVSNIIKEGIERTYFQCELRRVRMHKLNSELFNAICLLSARHDTLDEFKDKVQKVDHVLESMKMQWDSLRSTNEVEWMGKNNTKCKCTRIWEKNQEMLSKFQHLDDMKKEYEALKKAMTSMAEFGLTEEMTGCPMDFEHRIVLDETTIRKLSEEDQESTKSVPWVSDEIVVKSIFSALDKLQKEFSDMSWQMRKLRQSMDSLARNRSSSSSSSSSSE